MNDILIDLQTWYANQCDGDWEHQSGVIIQTLDNPGWLVKVKISETAAAEKPFVLVAENVGDDAHPNSKRWLSCRVAEGEWIGAGDETKLAVILRTFLDWAEGLHES